MKYAAYTNNYVPKYECAVSRFAQVFFDADKEQASKFIKDLGRHVSKIGFPCDKIALNVTTGYEDRVGFALFNGSEKQCYILLKSYIGGIIKIYSIYFVEGKDELKARFEPDFKAFFNKRNKGIYKRLVSSCGLSEKKCNAVSVCEFVDCVKRGEKTLTGSLADIFDEYTSMNDTFKYCGGHFYRFKDCSVSRLYRVFTTLYDGDYFLDNALKRGVLID